MQTNWIMKATGLGIEEETAMRKIFAFLMMAATLVACSREEQPEVPKTYTMTVNATKDPWTRLLELGGEDNKTLWAMWRDGDVVKVYEGEALLGLLSAAYLPADGLTCTLTGNVIAPSDVEQVTLKYHNDDYSNQGGTLSYISEHCDYATASVDVAINGKLITSSDAMFVNQQAIVKFTLKDKADDSFIAPSALTVTDGTHTATLTNLTDATYDTNGDGVLYVAFPAAGEAKTISLTATVGRDTYIYEKSGVTFNNGQYYAISVKMRKQAKLYGPFSVSADKQVCFSPGNLQYRSAHGGEWRFAENQWEYIGTWNTSDWVDLFGWGTWGEGKDPLNDSTNDEDYQWGSDFQGSMGEYGGWYTLSSAEWNYLFQNSHWGFASIYDDTNAAVGVVILPDGSSASIVENHYRYNDNVYSFSDWLSMEDDGALFLSAAGSRYGTNVITNDDIGFYWSSTFISTFEQGYAYAAGVTFEGRNGQWASDYKYRPYCGSSVRLVRNVD